MADVVLSAAVRQNLLSLQSTASLLATTQNNLATGKKVNSALDNPTNFFTAQSLDNRAGDINNLLDGIGNGVQVLQAANTGITSLQSLVSSAKSTANQVLQTQIGFSTKSSVTAAAILGATANNLLGATAADATFSGAAVNNNQTQVAPNQVAGVSTFSAPTANLTSAFASAAVPLGATAVTTDAKANAAAPLGALAAAHVNNTTTGTQELSDAAAPIANTTLLATPTGGANAATPALASQFTNGDEITVDGTIIKFDNTVSQSTAAAAAPVAGPPPTVTIGIKAGSQATIQTVLDAIDTITGTIGTSNASSVSASGQITLSTGVDSTLTLANTVGATPLAHLGFVPTAAPVPFNTGNIAAGTELDTLSTAITNGQTLLVNGTTIQFNTGLSQATAAAPAAVAGPPPTVTIGIKSGSAATIQTVLDAIDTITGTIGTSNASSVVNGKIQLQTGANADLVISNGSSALASFGLSGLGVAAGNVTQARAAAPADITASTLLVGTANSTSNDLGTSIVDGSVITIDGTHTVTFSATTSVNNPQATTNAVPAVDVNGNITINIAAGSKADISTILGAIDTLNGNTGAGSVASTVSGGKIQLQTGVKNNLTITAGTLNVLGILGLSTGTTTRAGDAQTTGAVTGATLLAAPASAAGTSVLGGPAISNGDTITVNGTTIKFDNTVSQATAAAPAAAAGPPPTVTIGIKTGSAANIQTVLDAIDSVTGGTSSIDAKTGAITLATNATTAITLGGTGNGLSAFGLTVQTIAVPTAPPVVSGATTLSGAASITSNALTSGFADGDTLTVDGKILTFSATKATSVSATGGTISTTGTVQDLLNAIDTITGATTKASIDAKTGAITLHTGANSALSITSSNAGALKALGFGTGVTQADSALAGQTLTIGATGNGAATSITFGTGAGQVSTLNQLNNALAPNNLQAFIDSNGVITLTTNNNAASSTIGQIGGTATPFSGLTAPPPVVDPNAQATRAGLVTQFNNILAQIDTTAQDSSFNGINLLEDDTLNLTFDESGNSKLAIQGATFNSAGLGLSALTPGTDFLDSNSANAVLAQLTTASSTLRSEASTLGSNLSIVQIRQDFSKNLINVLQTGSANLTIADTNEEAANSQALSTRQSIAVSALALANQSQQSVLQLLR